MELYEKLMKKYEAYEATHVKVRDNDMFRWFKQEGLVILRPYVDFGTKMDYEIDDDGITVKIITKTLVLLPEEEKGLMNVLSRASACFVDSREDGKLEIKLLYRGWKWLKKEDSDIDRSCPSESNNVE